MNSLFRTLCAGLLLGFAFTARATHNEAGEILVCHVGDSTSLTYRVTIITYTNPNSQADRPEFILDWGDNTPLDTIQRDSATLCRCSTWSPTISS